MIEHRTGANGIERRVVPGEVRITKHADGTAVLAGITAPFGKLSDDLGGFREQIEAGAFAEALTHSDPVALFNHNPDHLLGRASAKTLRLEEVDAGLSYEVDLPETAIGVLVRSGVERKDIQGNSFAFTVAHDEWQDQGDGTWLRTVKRIGMLYDLVPGVYPAYPDTSVALRSLAAARNRQAPAGLADEDRERLQRMLDMDLEGLPSGGR